jgi:hypothetical protein
VRPLRGLKVTANVAFAVPAFPSATERSATVRVGVGSSSVIVPTPVPSPTVAFVALASVTA